MSELATKKPILSLFPGAGLLDRAFEEEGFCVLRGPDILWGGDVRRFHCLPGFIGGVIGGPPCQDFSKLRRCEPSGAGVEMIGHFARLVTESACDWFLMENVPGVPMIIVPGYHVQRFNLAASECGAQQRRLRCLQFGNRHNERPLVIHRGTADSGLSPSAIASEGRRAGRRGWTEFCQLQGLPPDFHTPWAVTGGKVSGCRKRCAVANGPCPGDRRESLVSHGCPAKSLRLRLRASSASGQDFGHGGLPQAHGAAAA